MSKIKILPPDLVNHIAAGEVVDRPSAVIKETVENAIDAGATQIEVWVSADARSFRIADNGCGMDAADLQNAFKNHATSKITNHDDLFALSTLGFRGEALASIAAVAKVTCISKTAKSEHALKAQVDPDGSVKITETGANIGTTLEITDLFHNVPVRLKFLKQPKTELAYIEEMLNYLALSNPQVKMTYKIQDSEVFSTSGSGHVDKTLTELFKINPDKDLIRFEATDPELGLKAVGLTSLPSVYRSSKKWLFPFINGRSVRCHILSKAIEGAYESLITPGKYPITVLFFELPLDAVDVNVHPNKKEVRYTQPNSVYSFVRHAIRNAFEGQFIAASHNNTFNNNYQPNSNTTGAFKNNNFSNNTASYSSKSFSSSTSMRPTQQSWPLNSIAGNTVSELNSPIVEPGYATQNMMGKYDFRIVGQLSKTYILVEQADGMLIVDQHIASERCQYERLSKQADLTAEVSQTLMVPIIISASPTLADKLQNAITSFEQLGFKLQVTGSEVLIHAAPSLYTPQVLQQTIELMLASFEETGITRLNTDDVIATMACHSAVRAGDVLSPLQMEALISDWYACERPWTCPHGRPVSHLMPHQELMNLFDRPSLPV